MVFFLLLLMALPASANEEWVRVRLWKEEGQQFIIKGKIHRLQGIEAAHKFVAIPQEQDLTARFENERWIIEGFKTHPIIVSQKLLALEGSEISLNGRKAPAKVLLSANSKGVDVVGVLRLENYVTGVLAHEMPRQWPLETLKAQAVAARSYALAVMRERKNKVYHLESTVLDQVYSYLSEEELRSKFDRISEAVSATWGLVLINSKKKILKAYYHADCGGQTATADEAWTSKEELVSVQDTFCPQNPRGEWRLSMSSEELSEKLKKLAPAGAEKVKSVEALMTPGRLRIASLQVEWEQGEKKTISASKFREAVGYFDLKSTQFRLSKLGPNWIFSGRGFGHGVGLCQWGSRHLGQQGWDFKKIIQHYYPKAELQTMDLRIANLKNRRTL